MVQHNTHTRTHTHPKLLLFPAAPCPPHPQLIFSAARQFCSQAQSCWPSGLSPLDRFGRQHHDRTSCLESAGAEAASGSSTYVIPLVSHKEADCASGQLASWALLCSHRSKNKKGTHLILLFVVSPNIYKKHFLMTLLPNTIPTVPFKEALLNSWGSGYLGISLDPFHPSTVHSK